MNVLIIDDDHRNIFALKTALKSRGITANGILNGQEGLEILRNDPSVDVVLLDMMMPEFDGFEMLEEMQSLSQVKFPAVIAVTAKAMKGDRERCLLAGANGYVSKPVDIDLLIAEIKLVLSHE